MQYTSLILTALVASTVSAQAKNNGTRSGGAAAPSGVAKPTGARGGDGSKGTPTNSGSPVKATTAGAPGSLSQSGGLVTVAGLGVAFAVFM